MKNTGCASSYLSSPFFFTLLQSERAVKLEFWAAKHNTVDVLASILYLSTAGNIESLAKWQDCQCWLILRPSGHYKIHPDVFHTNSENTHQSTRCCVLQCFTPCSWHLSVSTVLTSMQHLPHRSYAQFFPLFFDSLYIFFELAHVHKQGCCSRRWRKQNTTKDANETCIVFQSIIKGQFIYIFRVERERYL